MLLKNETNLKKRRAILVSMVTAKEDPIEAEKSLDELERLLDTAGGETYARVVQNRATVNARTYIGSGKVREIEAMIEAGKVDLVVFDEELSPSQIRNLEADLGGQATVIDRTMLILDIFALHAVTGEGKLQVELAQLRYTAPRLIGSGGDLSRQGGGIGSRGPGESKLETDRRHVKERIHALEESIETLDKNRGTMRVARERSGLPRVAIAGYTNAGKSTLLNRLTDAGILAEDKLFATLDPTTRKFTLPGGESILLTDTVGFIRHLPHDLVSAFKSTLDEVREADLILLVLDASDAECQAQLQVTLTLLSDLDAADKPILYAMNKADAADPTLLTAGASTPTDRTVFISARTGEGIENLVAELESMLHGGRARVTFRIPNGEAGALNILYKNATVESVEYGADAIAATAVVDAKTRGMMASYDPEAAAGKAKNEPWEKSKR